MESSLTNRALRIFAVLENYRAGSSDILDALLPFFEPILVEFSGHTLDAGNFAGRVTEVYRWNFTADIVEELIPRFEMKGWVKKIGGTNQEVIYRVTYDNPDATPALESDQTKITQTLIYLAKEFSEFIKVLSPLTAVAIPPNRLADILVEWLISIDAYTEDVLRTKALQVTNIEGRIGMDVVINDSSSLSSDEKYLCARFVKHLFAQKSPYIAELCKLASIGLLTEVVQDFHKPTTKIEKTNLVVYLDAPVALDLLGVSGKEAAANIRPIIQKLQDIGGTVRIFRVSIRELQGALDAVLRRTPTERTGPTAGALRRNEVLEAFVRQVTHDPGTFLSEYNVGIVERTLDQFPNEHEYFSRDDYEGFVAKMVWHVEVPRREHDATIVAQVMRMRKGMQTRDLFKSRHLLITRNALLSESAKQYCTAGSLSERTSVGPAVHQRQLATAIWLRTGLSDIQQEIPRRHLLAACERVLELKKSVVDQVRIVSRSLTPEKAKQLDLLLTQDRSTQLLMDKTLGSSNVVNANTIEPLLDEMKKTLTEQIENDAADAIGLAKKDAAERVRRANERRAAVEQDNANLTASIERAELSDADIVDALLLEVNSALHTRRWITNACVFGIIFLVGILPPLTETMSSTAKIFCLVVAGLLAAAFSCLQIFDIPVGLDARIMSWGRSRIKRLAEDRGIGSKLEKYHVEWVDRAFRRATPFSLE